MLNYNMRPQDVVVLLKIICRRKQTWMSKDLAAELFLSTAEISNSLQRSSVSGLYDIDNKKVRMQSLLDFLVHGLPYVFPQRPGGIVRGLPTAHGHDYFKDKIVSSEIYVWPDAESNDRGFSIEPLYPGAVRAAKGDMQLYLFLSIIDVLRTGKVREKQIAIDKLKAEFNESPY